MNIRTKLLGTVFLSVALLVISTLGATLYLNRLHHKSVNNFLKYGNELEMVFQLELAFARVIMPANDYLIHGDEEERYTFEFIDAEINNMFDRLEGKYFPTRIMVEEKEFLNHLKGQYALIKTLCEKILNLPDPIGNAEGVRLMEEMGLLVDNLSEDMRPFHRNTRLIVLKELEVIDNCFYRYMIAILSTLALIVIASLFYVLFLAKSIVAPIRRLVGYMGIVARGDFTQRLDIKTKDEIGQIATALGKMTESLRKTTVSRDMLLKEKEERYLAETSLRESEEKFRCISTSAKDAIIMTNNESKISYWNEASERIFGFSKEEAVGKYVHSLIVPERLRKNALEGYKRFKDTGQGPLIEKTIEVTGLKKDGTEIPIEISLSTVEIKGKWNAIGIVRDITKRKQAEKAVQKARKYADNIVATVREPLVILDKDLRVVSAGRSFYTTFMVSSEETEGQLFYELCNHQWDIPALRTLLEKLLQEKTPIEDYEMECNFKTIGQKTMLLNARRIIEEEEEEEELILLTIEDITERKHLEEQIRTSYKMASLGRLTAGVFHEILNPVNIISSHIQLLLMEAEKGSKTEEDLKSIQEEINRIVKITDGLLRFARKGKLVTEEVDTNSLLEKILSIVEPDMKLENVKIMKRFEDKLPMVITNSDELRQVFLNLITNARDAMPDGGTLTISTQSIKKRGKPFVTVKFKDSGIGIKKEDIDKVFDPFYTTKAEGEGTGLGLSTSFGITENHGGRMSVNSKEGKGATFTVELPAKD